MWKFYTGDDSPGYKVYVSVLAFDITVPLLLDFFCCCFQWSRSSSGTEPCLHSLHIPSAHLGQICPFLTDVDTACVFLFPFFWHTTCYQTMRQYYTYTSIGCGTVGMRVIYMLWVTYCWLVPSCILCDTRRWALNIPHGVVGNHGQTLWPNG